MSVQSFPELLVHDLGDLLFAEKTILKALKQMIRETSNAEIRARLEQHHGETQQQVRNLEQAFELLGERARGQKCPGILGIIEEHDEFKKEEEPSKPILEAFDLGAGLRVEHYEIAAYRSAIAIARNMGLEQVVALLQQNLDQEQAMADYLEGAAPMALEAARANADAAAARRRPTKKAAAKKRSATKRSAKKTSAKKATTKKSTSRKSTAKKSTAKKSTAKKGSAKRARR